MTQSRLFRALNKLFSSILMLSFVLLLPDEPREVSKPAYNLYLPLIQNGDIIKAGVAFASHDNFEERVLLLDGTVSAWRGWQTRSIPKDIAGLTNIPSLWCDTHFRPGTSGYENQMVLIQLLGKDYTGPLLFLNEPDLAFYNRYGQCDISPKKAAYVYLYVRDALPNAQLVGPGISHVDYLNGFRWLDIFINEVKSVTGSVPDMQAWDMHNYLDSGSPLEPHRALESFLISKGVESPKLWVSEWGACTPARVALTKGVFDRSDIIIRHFWYDQYGAYWDGPNRCINLFTETTPIELSPIGLSWMEQSKSLQGYP